MQKPIRKSARIALWELFIAGVVFTPLMAIRDHGRALSAVPAAVGRGLEIVTWAICGAAALINVCFILAVWVKKIRGQNDLMPAVGVTLVLATATAGLAALWLTRVSPAFAAVGTAAAGVLIVFGSVVRRFGARRADKKAAKSAAAKHAATTAAKPTAKR